MRFKKPDRYVYTCFLHCSASDIAEHDDVSVIDAWHRANGWNCIGYHFFIKADGTVQKGRDLELTPAAQYGHNTGSLAICLHGHKHFTDAQFKSLKKLCKKINKAYDNGILFHGHKEVDPGRDCPVYDYRKILNLDSNGVMES